MPLLAALVNFIIMNFTKLKDRVLFYLSVPKCVNCGEKLSFNEKALCSKCFTEYTEFIKRNCSICANTLNECTCTNKYLDLHYVHNVVKVFRYFPGRISPSNSLIYSLKRDNRKDVLEFLTKELAYAISHAYTNLNDFVFVNVPRRRSSVVKYGIDHAQLLAKSLAKYFSAEYYQPIVSKSKKAQKKAVGKERISNVNFKLKFKTKSLKGKTVIIVDDVITTGASIGACAMLIHALGAKRIIGASVSIAYKDMYIPLSKENRFYQLSNKRTKPRK